MNRRFHIKALDWPKPLKGWNLVARAIDLDAATRLSLVMLDHPGVNGVSIWDTETGEHIEEFELLLREEKE